MKRDWRKSAVCAGLALALGACTSAHPTDPDARSFTGTIVSLRPFTNVMMISNEVHDDKGVYPNQTKILYDKDTKFLMDGQPTTIEHITQYMTVHIDGHMRDGQCFAEIANFSSVLPKNVKSAESK